VSTEALAPEFDLDAPWMLNEQVSVRPERFGALLYHFGTRRLSFLKDRVLLDVVRGLESQPSARAALTVAGVRGPDLHRYRVALATLAASTTISPRRAA
jgi:putative mycofactocin binding protein MftB